MKNRFYSTLQAAGIAMACWLLPTKGSGSVLVNNVCYDLDEATKTAVVVPGSDKNINFLTIPETITYEDVTYTVTAIADCAFLDCHNLFAVYIESHSLTDIGFSAFERCYSLYVLQFVDGLIEFQYEAFKNCRNLQRVILPSTLRAIGDRSFLGCTSLTTINIPASVDYIGHEWVSGCPLYLLLAESKTPLPVKANRFTGIDKETCILGVPKGCKEAYQAADVWKDFLNIEEDVIEVGQCGDKVFYSIFVNGTMKVWGNGAMYDYWWESPVSELGVSYVKDLTIEEGVTHIGAYAFQAWEDLSSINVPNSLTTIGKSAFAGTPWFNIQPDGVVYLGKLVYGLKGMEGADAVLLEGTVGHAASAFMGCNIASLSIPSSMTSIYPATYEYDDGHFYDAAFGDIGSIAVDAGNPLYDSREGCNAIIETATNTVIVGSRNMEIPEDVTAIGPFVFGSQTSAFIPSNVTVVDNLAFCSSVYVDRPSPIDYAIFHAVTSPIESIKMEGSVPPALSITNPSLKYNYGEEHLATLGGPAMGTCILYVPFGSKEAYQSAPGWKEFQNIVEYDPEEGGTTAIETVLESSTAPRQIYDLQGRRLNDASTRSIIIENGKKRIQR